MKYKQRKLSHMFSTHDENSSANTFSDYLIKEIDQNANLTKILFLHFVYYWKIRNSDYKIQIRLSQPNFNSNDTMHHPFLSNVTKV